MWGARLSESPRSARLLRELTLTGGAAASTNKWRPPRLRRGRSWAGRGVSPKGSQESSRRIGESDRAQARRCPRSSLLRRRFPRAGTSAVPFRPLRKPRGQSARCSLPDESTSAVRLLAGTNKASGNRLRAAPSAPDAHPSSCQSRTSRWSIQRLDGRRRAASRDCDEQVRWDRRLQSCIRARPGR
jgi:hypothetical protein